MLEAPAENRLGERPAPLAEQLGAVLAVEDAQIQLPLLIDQIDAALHSQQVGDGGGAGLLDLQLTLRHLALQLDAIEGVSPSCIACQSSTGLRVGAAACLNH